MPDTPPNPDALASLIEQVQEAIDHVHLDPREFFDLSDVLYQLKAVAQPEVNSDTELHVGTLIEDKTGQQFWNVWRTGGPAVHWVDDEGRPATPVFPARVLWSPEVQP